MKSMKKRKPKRTRRVYKYQLREHPKNKRLGNMLDDLGDVHNHFLALEKRYYRRYGLYAGRYRLQPHLTKLLKRTKQHWAWIPRDTLDEVIVRIHITYERFFDGLGGLPKFKRKDRYRSAKFQSAYLIEEGRARLSFKAWDEPSHSFKFHKCWFSFHHHRDWKGNVRYTQILKSLSRKVKGSNNWWRAVRELSRLYRKIANQRKDWHWKLATNLCKRFDTIVTETLNLAGMKRLWGRKVSDLAFGAFVEILKFKCFKHKREFRQVGQWTPTTKPCSDCGYHNEKISLSNRQWRCPDCGSHHDRDINAAINILRAALDPSVEQM